MNRKKPDFFIYLVENKVKNKSKFFPLSKILLHLRETSVRLAPRA
jgi:hypothetical protein